MLTQFVCSTYRIKTLGQTGDCIWLCIFDLSHISVSNAKDGKKHMTLFHTCCSTCSDAHELCSLVISSNFGEYKQIISHTSQRAECLNKFLISYKQNVATFKYWLKHSFLNEGPLVSLPLHMPGLYLLYSSTIHVLSCHAFSLVYFYFSQLFSLCLPLGMVPLFLPN